MTNVYFIYDYDFKIIKRPISTTNYFSSTHAYKNKKQ